MSPRTLSVFLSNEPNPPQPSAATLGKLRPSSVSPDCSSFMFPTVPAIGSTSTVEPFGRLGFTRSAMPAP